MKTLEIHQMQGWVNENIRNASDAQAGSMKTLEMHQMQGWVNENIEIQWQISKY